MDLARKIVKRYFYNPLIILAVCSLLAFLVIRSASATSLESLETVSSGAGKSQIKLSFKDKVPEVEGYILDYPARIVVNLPDTKNLTKRYHEIDKNGIRRITIVQAGKDVRLIIALDDPSSYQSSIIKNQLFLSISSKVKKAEENKSEIVNKKILMKVKQKQTEKSERPSLKAVDFQRGKDSSGNIIFMLSHPDSLININNDNQSLTVDFNGVDLPEILKQRLDVTEFGTAVQYIDIKKTGKKTQAVIELNGKYEYLSWQSEKKFTLSVSKISSAKKGGTGKLNYSNDKLSLNFQDIEIRAVLQLLADEQNFNLVASDAVKGNITLRLEDVPWDHALNIILRSKGLDKRLEGNVLIVAPAQELASRERQSLESNQKIKDLAPLYTELLQINYAKASDMVTVLQGSGSNRILSERGSVQVVERTNSLLISETKEKIKEISKLIKEIDIPVKQVMIEARIVEARTSLRDELGVAWGKVKAKADTNILNSGGRATIDDVFVKLPTSAASAGITFGYITNSLNLSLSLSALEADSKVEIISRPQIITANKKKAIIKKGQERAFATTSEQGTNTIFKDVSLALEVTPQITPDGRIIMDVDVTNNEVTGEDGNGHPITSINEINTQLLVNDGQTVVLGGILKNILTKSKETVPLLGKLPIIGSLFRRNIDNEEKSELLIFITPRIITDEVAVKT